MPDTVTCLCVLGNDMAIVEKSVQDCPAHRERKSGWCACYVAEAGDVVWAVCPTGLCSGGSDAT